jgi:hypothetical protein
MVCQKVGTAFRRDSPKPSCHVVPACRQRIEERAIGLAARAFFFQQTSIPQSSDAAANLAL